MAYQKTQQEVEYGKEVEEMKGQGILVVEDEAIMRESLRDWLTTGGYRVDTVEDGEQALQLIQKQDFGVAVLDLRLPGKDGIEVLKEAKKYRPELKTIIITAYPSVETAVQAIKLGAVDYLTKPLDLDKLEQLLQEALGPVQLEIRAKAPVEEAKVEELPRVEEAGLPTEAEILVRLEEAKEHLKAGRLAEAIRGFEAILKVAPGNLEVRKLLRQAKKRVAKPEVEGEVTNPCVWMKMGVVPYRVCTNNYNCLTCEFDHEMQEKMAAGGGEEIEKALGERLKLPGNQRLCRYALVGQVSYRLCSRLFQCATCEFAQQMEEELQRKMAKLAARREALRKKEARATT